MLNISYSFTKGFSIDKYLSKFVVSDYIVGHADYFKFRYGSENQSISESMIAAINNQSGVEKTGKVYCNTFISSVGLNEQQYKIANPYYSEEQMEPKLAEKDENDIIESDANIFGLDDFPMENLTLLDGSFDEVRNGRGIAQIIMVDDYGNPQMSGAVYKIRDKVKVTYNMDEIVDENGNEVPMRAFIKEYQVVANITMPYSIGLRRYGGVQLAMSSSTFINDTGVTAPMIYMVDINDSQQEQMENFMKKYTQFSEPDFSFESKWSFFKEFDSFKNMFMLIGGILSLTIGLRCFIE